MTAWRVILTFSDQLFLVRLVICLDCVPWLVFSIVILVLFFISVVTTLKQSDVGKTHRVIYLHNYQ